MSRLRFVCPTERLEIDSGIDIDSKSFQQCRGKSVAVQCPACQTLHHFTVDDGCIDELRVA